MPSLTAIAYTSVASRPLSARDLDSILVDARSFNQKVGVTGALLHAEGVFFQYFEGPAAGVTEVYNKIKLSDKHKDIRELVHESIDVRKFPAWHMAFAEAPSTALEELTNEYWEIALPELRQQAPSPGLKLLLEFWNSATHRSSDNPRT